MYQFILKALVETFSLIPIGGATFRYDRIVTALIEFMSDYVIISFRIFLPVFASMLLLNAILGILAKVAPQLNMFSVGIQIKILMGTMVLIIMLSPLLEMITNKHLGLALCQAFSL